MKNKKIWLLTGIIAFAVCCFFLFFENDNIAVYLTIGLISALMFCISKRESTPFAVRRALSFAFRVGAVYLVIQAVKLCAAKIISLL